MRSRSFFPVQLSYLTCSFISVAIVLRLAKSWFRIGSLEILEHNSEEALLRCEAFCSFCVCPKAYLINVCFKFVIVC